MATKEPSETSAPLAPTAPATEAERRILHRKASNPYITYQQERFRIVGVGSVRGQWKIKRFISGELRLESKEVEIEISESEMLEAIEDSNVDHASKEILNHGTAKKGVHHRLQAFV